MVPLEGLGDVQVSREPITGKEALRAAVIALALIPFAIALYWLPFLLLWVIMSGEG
jgi:hypothetical protein